MKHINTVKKYGFGASLIALATNALAAPPSYTALTDAVDFSTMITATGLVFVALIGLTLFIAGATLIWNKVRGARRG